MSVNNSRGPGQPTPELDWTLTQYETALVRVRIVELGGASSSAELVLMARRRRHRFLELPRPVGVVVEAGRPATTATFEVPVAMVQRQGLRARVHVGGVQAALDWGELGRLGPRPAEAFAPGATPVPDAPASAPAPLDLSWADGGGDIPEIVRDDPPRFADVQPARRWAPRSLPFRAAADGASGHVRTGSALHATRGFGRGRPQPMTHPRPLGVGGLRPAADCFSPITVDRALLRFMPYEDAAPRLALPIRLRGDVLTVAVALPSVDLSVITDRSPWLTIKQEVTGYHEIVKALREVEALLGRRASRSVRDDGVAPHPPGAISDPTDRGDDR